MKLELGYPPTANTMFPTNRAGRRTLSTKGRIYREGVRGDVLEQHGLIRPLQGPIRVSVDFFVPDKRRRDLDNLFKALFDALKYANVYVDDDQIVEIHAFKREVVKGGRCEIVIEEL